MTDKIKLKADKFVNDRKLKLNYLKPKDLKILLAEFCKEQIAELKAECDLALEGRDIKIRELEEDYKTLMTSYNILKDNDEKIIKEMGEQIEKMKCCGNCNGILDGGRRAKKCRRCMDSKKLSEWELEEK